MSMPAREVIRATNKAREAARENLRLAWGRYQVGVGTIIEVTDAQVQFSQADLRLRPGPLRLPGVRGPTGQGGGPAVLKPFPVSELRNQ